MKVRVRVRIRARIRVRVRVTVRIRVRVRVRIRVTYERYSVSLMLARASVGRAALREAHTVPERQVGQSVGQSVSRSVSQSISRSANQLDSQSCLAFEGFVVQSCVDWWTAVRVCICQHLRMLFV